jgi:hypothetical protein
MRQLAEQLPTQDEAVAEARSIVALTLESLNAFAAFGDPAHGFALRDAAMRLASWHPYFVDRMASGAVTSSDFDELNYILDALFELNRIQGPPANASLIRATLWLRRVMRIYREAVGFL